MLSNNLSPEFKGMMDVTNEIINYSEEELFHLGIFLFFPRLLSKFRSDRRIPLVLDRRQLKELDSLISLQKKKQTREELVYDLLDLKPPQTFTLQPIPTIDEIHQILSDDEKLRLSKNEDRVEVFFERMILQLHMKSQPTAITTRMFQYQSLYFQLFHLIVSRDDVENLYKKIEYDLSTFDPLASYVMRRVQTKLESLRDSYD